MNGYIVSIIIMLFAIAFGLGHYGYGFVGFLVVVAALMVTVYELAKNVKEEKDETKK